ncbi:hypothetical protein SUGI_0388310 [Cryptomeria japonica]|nr:hypothetical protein SUGI_0388310 [Cryptomeria japonica]
MREVGHVSDRLASLEQWAQTHKTQLGFVLITSVAIGVGAQVHKTQKPMKTVATSIKLADSVLKGLNTIQILHSPTPSHIIFLTLGACKALAKGASKGILIQDKNGSFKKLSKTLKASEGALNLVRYSSALGAADPWDYVIRGYKLSKSVFNVVDGVNGVRAVAARGYGVIKGGLEGVGVVIKALVLSKKVYGILFQGFGISHGAFRIISEEYMKKEEENQEECVSMKKRQRVSGLQAHGLAEIGFDKSNFAADDQIGA